MVAVAMIVLVSYVMNITQLSEYVTQVVSARAKLAPFLVPEAADVGDAVKGDAIPAECLLDCKIISDCLKDAGKDVSAIIPTQVVVLVSRFIV